LCPTREEIIISPPETKEHEKSKSKFDDPEGSIGVFIAGSDKRKETKEEK
jgi:hypothetical protein